MLDYIENARVEFGESTVRRWQKERKNIEWRLERYPLSYTLEELLQGRDIIYRRCYMMNRRFKLIYFYDETNEIVELLPNHHIYNKVIARCTAENPSDRYQSTTEVARVIASSTRSRHFLYVLIALLFVVAVVVFILLSQGKEPQQEQRVAPVDTLSVKSVDTTSVTPVSVLPREEDKQQKKVQTTSSIPEPVTPAPSPSKKTSIEQLRADISKAVLPKFNATLGALSDSVQPGTTAWTEAGWALEASLENTLKDLILSHSDIPMEQVVKEYTSYLQTLITQKYNKAMKRQPK